MKKIATLLGVAAIIAFASSCAGNTENTQNQESAAPAAQSGPQKGSIVYFNLDRILQEYDMANELRSVVETKVNSINQEVNRRGTKLEKDVNDFRDKLNKGLLTQSVAEQRNQKLIEQQQSFETYANQKQQEILEEQQVMMNQIADAINTYLQEFNAEKQYSMIIATQGELLATPVAAGDPELDITDTLLEGLNAAYIKQKNSEQ